MQPLSPPPNFFFRWPHHFQNAREGPVHEVNFLFPRMTNTTTKKTSGQCKTRNGVPCVFPFTYHGTKYTSCKTWWESKGSSWCATKTLNGKYIGIWGWCSEDCSVHTGK